jgi:hypothetical protein
MLRRCRSVKCNIAQTNHTPKLAKRLSTSSSQRGSRGTDQSFPSHHANFDALGSYIFGGGIPSTDIAAAAVAALWERCRRGPGSG